MNIILGEGCRLDDDDTKRLCSDENRSDHEFAVTTYVLDLFILTVLFLNCVRKCTGILGRDK